VLAVLSLLVTACAPQEYHPETPARYQTAASCLQSNRDHLYVRGVNLAIRALTVATGDPAFPPWWEGGTTDEHSEWTLNDPYLGRGYEGAVTFEVARRLGFSEDQVQFVPVDFDMVVGPGEKDFDFAIQQISPLPNRMAGLDLTEGYLDVNEALVSVQGSPIAGVTSLEELKDAKLAASIDTASLAYIEDSIQPSTPPTVYDDLNAAVRGLRRGRVDGIVADVQSASVIAEEQIHQGVIVGRLPANGSREHFAIALEKESPLVECVNLALQGMKDDGTLEEIRRKWLPSETDAPLIQR
jgi:polar amino acid transport system substrate-binding protein